MPTGRRLFRLAWRSAGAVAGLFVVAVVGGIAFGNAAPEPTCDIPPSGNGFAIPRTAHNVTARLDALRAGSSLKADRVAAALRPVAGDLSRMKVLVVPGYLTEFLDAPRDLGLSDYLDSQEAALKPLSRGVRRLALETEASVARNAAAIARAVAATDGPLCLVSHSKGGIDALEFLLRAPASERRKVRCWIAFQAPFAGSPVADMVAGNELLRASSAMLLPMFGGDAASLHDLRADTRRCYLAAHDRQIAALARQVRIIAVASAIGDDIDAANYVSPMLPALLLLRQMGIRSDGLVPTASAVLPHADYVLLDSLDHTGTVADGADALPFEQRKRLTLALLALALR